ncbi:MAG: hypothetical protein GY762_07010 [Proteobacteria bacterium]|nr:hypothetical protein [Pseudomonadota bacterium]
MFTNNILRKILFASMMLSVVCLYAQAQLANPPYPDVQDMINEPLDNVTDGIVACDWEALRYRMRSCIYQSNPGRLDNPRLTQFERLALGDPEDVAAVNEEIIAYCQRKEAEIKTAWQNPKLKHPAKQVCQYQTELIPLAIMALRIGEQLTPEAHQAIKDVILEFRPETADVEPAMWMHAPGYNGANSHDLLSFLAMSWEVTGNLALRDAAFWGLRNELDSLNITGDIAEFNVLEAHWCGFNGYDAMKAYLSDPEMARMARMIAERLWINRFLTWSPVVERITGPGSRMAPGAWLGTSGDRLQFATGVEKPIWLNEFFDWGVWQLQPSGGRWPLDDVQGMVPDLPDYLQDVAWRKQYPNELRSSVQLIPWMHRYPALPDWPDERPDPVLGEIVSYQTSQYALGSINQPYEASTGMLYASAWWNDSRVSNTPLGSPKRFAALYPHYVFNGAAALDRTELYFENNPEQPLKDGWTGQPGPWMREFVDWGRAGIFQHKNTMLYLYSGRNRHHSDEHQVPGTLRRASASMSLFRWEPGLEGLYINKTPITSLPAEFQPGDWWFIHDGDTYTGIRPLEATALRGSCKITLEARTRQLVLYQDNYVGDSIEGITDEEWVKAQSGFVVELGDAKEYGSFENFRNTMLKAKVREKTDDFVRHVRYKRPGRKLEMKWHCYEEEYLLRRADGVDQITPRHLQSPEFAVGAGVVQTHDARLETKPDEALWLLSATPSRTYVAYQPQQGRQLPLTLKTPIAHIESKSFPFGKLAITQNTDDTLNVNIDASFRPFWSSVQWRVNIWQDLGTHPGDILIQTDAPTVTATINGDEMPVIKDKRDGKSVWLLNPYAKIPRVRDRVHPAGGDRPTN